jgi:hypothetical protein
MAQYLKLDRVNVGIIGPILWFLIDKLSGRLIWVRRRDLT